MKNIVFIIILFLNLTVFAQKQPQITVSKYDVNVEPGSHVSVFLVASNLSSTNLNSSVSLPDGWQVIVHKKQEIDSSSVKYQYTFASTKTTRAGKTSVVFKLQQDGVTMTEKSIDFEVISVKTIEILNVQQPEYVLEGDSLVTEYLVQNLGNSSETIKLSTSRGEVINHTAPLFLEANSSIRVKVRQLIPITENNSWNASADLKVFQQDSEVPVYQVTSVPVYSNSSKKADAYYRFPVQVGGSFLNFNIGGVTTIAYQYLAAGKGFVDLSEKHHIDFTIRGPNALSFPTIGSYDQYSFEYTHKSDTKVSVGDYVNKINNLIEFSRFGRGIKVEHKIEKSDFQAFFQKARFLPTQRDAFGFGYSYNLKESIKFDFSYFNKEIINEQAVKTTNIIGLASQIRKEWYSIETEVALGKTKSKVDVAIFNRFNLQFNKFNFNSEVISAGKEFYGFYTNSKLLINGLSYSISKKLNVGVNSNFTRINPSLDLSVYSFSPISKTNMVFTSYQPNSKHLFFLNYTLQEREDRKTPSSFHYKEDYGNLSYSLNHERLMIFTQARYGNAQNLLAFGDENKAQRSFNSMLQPTVKVMSGLWLGAYFEHQNTSKFSQNNTIQNLFYYGGNLRANYKSFVHLNFMYRNNYAPDEFFEKRSFMDGSLVFDFKKHQVNLTTGRVFMPGIMNSGQNTLFFTLKYVLKLNVPIRKNRNIGHVAGNIVGISDGIQKGGLIVQLGQYRTVTDSSGNFHFNNLKPDTYHITLKDDLSMQGVVADIKSPLEIIVKADSTERISIPLIKTGGLTGKVNFELEERNQKLSDNAGLPIVLVRLSNESESFLTQVNEKQEFSFKEIKPGKWKVLVFIPGKQEQFEVVNKEKNVEIGAEKLIQESFVVKSIERKIFFSGKDFKLITKK